MAMANPDPLWLRIARLEKGVKETAGPASTDRILEYLQTVDLEGMGRLSDDISWCSAFVNWVVRQAGYTGTDSAAARSWLKWGETISEPRIGAVVVLKRGTEAWQGHVGFVTGVHGGFVQVLGGNQSNSVNEQLYKTSLVLGYRWPRGILQYGPRIEYMDEPRPRKLWRRFWNWIEL